MYRYNPDTFEVGNRVQQSDRPESRGEILSVSPSGDCVIRWDFFQDGKNVGWVGGYHTDWLLLEHHRNPDQKICVWCQALAAAPGDIYCEGCRSAVIREEEAGNSPSEFEQEYDYDYRRNPMCMECLATSGEFHEDWCSGALKSHHRVQRNPKSHIHSKECDKVAIIRYLLDGKEKEWSIGAGCADSEETIKAHLSKWIPKATFVSVQFIVAPLTSHAGGGLTSSHSPNLATDPRAISCECGRLLYPGEICSCKYQRNPHPWPGSECPACGELELIECPSCLEELWCKSCEYCYCCEEEVEPKLRPCPGCRKKSTNLKDHRTTSDGYLCQGAPWESIPDESSRYSRNPEIKKCPKCYHPDHSYNSICGYPMMVKGELVNCDCDYLSGYKLRRNPESDQIELESGDFGWDYLIRNLRTDETLLIQTDYDYPGLATTFGWNKVGEDLEDTASCFHTSTDGTVDCRECGKTASEFIAEAAQYLDDHIGDVVEDPGYFLSDE